MVEQTHKQDSRNIDRYRLLSSLIKDKSPSIIFFPQQHKEVMRFKFRKNRKIPELFLEWCADETVSHRTRHKISLFTVVDCIVYANEGPLQWSVSQVIF